MSSSDGVVTARDVLSWAINQGVFTEKGNRQRELHQPVANGIDGPWIDILDALIIAADEGLADPLSGIHRNGQLDGFEDYVEARCLANLTHNSSLTAAQSAVVMKLAEDVRQFFDGTISIAPSGLGGPIEGDLFYHCGFDYVIEIPQWAASRAT